MATRSAVLLGPSGLVGGHLLRLLAGDPAYGTIKAFTRRPLGLSAGTVHEVLVDYDLPESYRRHLSGVDDVFCCLGTTIKVAGSQQAFRKVDLETPVAVARESRAAGAGQVLIVTAVGADAKSRVFYNRIKGETEDLLRALDFPRGLKIFHPSLLLGDRAEPRAGEKVAAFVMRATRPIFSGPLAPYRAIDALDVARAMLASATRDGVQVYEGESLFALARGAT